MQTKQFHADAQEAYLKVQQLLEFLVIVHEY